MRTSRISRDTARVVNALSSPRKTRTSKGRSALRSFSYSGGGSHGAAVEQETTEQDIRSDSDLSSVPSSTDEAFTPEPPLSLKRKRGTAGIASSVVVKNKETTLIEASTISNTTSNINGKLKGASRKGRRQPAKKTRTASGEVKIEPPANWEEMYTLTQQMRLEITAPVDTMGCERLADVKDTPRNQRFQTLVSLMLSSQTKDTVTAAAIANLKENLPGSLTLDSILAVSPTRLNELIQKVGFHNTKTKHIQQTAAILRDNFNSDIPDSIDGLISLPGVGPKMAYLCMSAAWGRDEGIGVDVHVHRITNLWGWHKTNTPEETRKSLQAWLPREKWHEINHLLVGFGQTICAPVGRKCGECVLAERVLCPGAVVKKGVGKKVKREVAVINAEAGVKEEVDVGELEVKAEDVGVVGDIEDIGSPPRNGRRRVQT